MFGVLVGFVLGESYVFWGWFVLVLAVILFFVGGVRILILDVFGLGLGLLWLWVFDDLIVDLFALLMFGSSPSLRV